MLVGEVKQRFEETGLMHKSLIMFGCSNVRV